jgi:hypothetical protein
MPEKMKIYRKVIEKIKDTSKILILDPGEAKIHMKKENAKGALHAKFFFQKNAAA